MSNWDVFWIITLITAFVGLFLGGYLAYKYRWWGFPIMELGILAWTIIVGGQAGSTFTILQQQGYTLESFATLSIPVIFLIVATIGAVLLMKD